MWKACLQKSSTGCQDGARQEARVKRQTPKRKEAGRRVGVGLEQAHSQAALRSGRNSRGRV
jgi:hypothetical protein